MGLFDALIVGGRFLLEAVIATTIPFVCMWVMGVSFRALCPDEARAMPLFRKLCITSGLLLGVGLLTAMAKPDLVGIESFFARPGPWDLTLREFLLLRVNPFGLDVPWLYDRIWQGGLRGDLAVLFIGAIGCLVVLAIYCGVSSRPWDTARSIAGSVVYTLLVAYILFYVVCFAIWTVNTLNFWVCLVLLFWMRRPFNFSKALNF